MAVRKTQKKYEGKIRELQFTDKNYQAKYLYKCAQSRARRKKIPFNIKPDDIIIPDICPVFGVKLIRSSKTISLHSATIDRIIPSLGYTKDNIIVVSNKANMIKNNATIDELIVIASFYSKLMDESS